MQLAEEQAPPAKRTPPAQAVAKVPMTTNATSSGKRTRRKTKSR
jgi:hypothetical protein